MKFELQAKPSHFVQALAQGSIYFYWSQFYYGVRDHAPYIVLQLAFAFAVQSLLLVLRDKPIRVGFDVFPIVLSLNLFIWAKPDYFYLQLSMVALAILGKEFVTRETAGGRSSHIFNPSAFALAAMALLIICFRLNGLFNTREVVLSYMAVPYFYLFVFAVGCFSHWVGRVSLISLGAVGTLVGLDFIIYRATGLPSMESVVHQSVFIGVTLLITDPATSPKSGAGQLLFGALYGLSITCSHAVLTLFQQPTYYDKVLLVPALNFIAPYLDRFSPPREWPWRPLLARVAPIAIYTLFLLSLLPVIEREFYRIPIAFARSRPWYPPKVEPELKQILKRRWQAQCSVDSRLAICGHLSDF